MSESTLEAELEADIEACSKSARRNYAFAYYCLALGLLATIAAAYVSASEYPKEVLLRLQCFLDLSCSW